MLNYSRIGRIYLASRISERFLLAEKNPHNLTSIATQSVIPKTLSTNLNIRHCSGKNVDKSQVEVMAKLCDVWWDTNGEVRVLHSFNALRVPFVRDGILSTLPNRDEFRTSDSPLRGLKLLDVGCGGGILTESLSRLGGQIVGLDASERLLNVAKSHASLDPGLSGTLSYVNSTIEDHSATNSEEYDAVVVSEVLEHIPEPDSFIQCCVRTLKPGGSVFITTFNKTFLSWLCGIILAENVFFCIPKGTHEWKLFVSPQEVSKMLEKYNCEVASVRGINLNPLNNKWNWVKHKQISYGLHAIKGIANSSSQ